MRASPPRRAGRRARRRAPPRRSTGRRARPGRSPRQPSCRRRPRHGGGRRPARRPAPHGPRSHPPDRDASRAFRGPRSRLPPPRSRGAAARRASRACRPARASRGGTGRSGRPARRWGGPRPPPAGHAGPGSGWRHHQPGDGHVTAVDRAGVVEDRPGPRARRLGGSPDLDRPDQPAGPALRQGERVGDLVEGGRRDLGRAGRGALGVPQRHHRAHHYHHHSSRMEGSARDVRKGAGGRRPPRRRRPPARAAGGRRDGGPRPRRAARRGGW
jgi:hypothetical protein